MIESAKGSVEAYREISNQTNQQDTSTEQTPQERLFTRVSKLLNNAGVTVKGQGSLALDIDESGQLEIIGNIDNKNEIAAVLGGDSEILSNLKEELSTEGDNSSSRSTSKWSQEAYYVELNGKEYDEYKFNGDMHSTSAPEITGEFYGKFNTWYNTDDNGFKENTGVDFAFKKNLFDTGSDRNSFFSYINDKLKSQIDGFDGAANMSFSLEQINFSKNMTANNYRIKVESAKGEDVDNRVAGILNADSYVKNTMFETMNNLRDYHTVVGAHYSNTEQWELNVFGSAWGDIFDVEETLHYSTATENNKESIAAAQKMWDITKNASQSELNEYAKHQRIIEDIWNDDIPPEGSMISSQSNTTTESTLVSTVLDNTEDVAPGTEVATAQVVDNAGGRLNWVMLDTGNIGNLLGLKTGSDLNSLISSQLKKVDKLKEAASTQVNDILAEQGMSIGDEDKVDIGVAEDGTITVTSIEGGKDGEALAAKLQEALNNDPEKAKELADSLQELDVNQTALTELTTKDGLTIGTAYKLYEMMPDNADKEELSGLFEDIDGIDDISDNVVAGITFSAGDFVSNDIETTLPILEKTIQEMVMDGMTGYNDENAELGISEINGPPVTPDMYIQSFEAILDADGNLEVTGGINGEGEELTERLKTIAGKILNTEKIGAQYETISSLLLEQHSYEDGDTDEFEHSVKVSVDYQKGISYEVISPEADEAATKELGDGLREISQSASEYLKEEYDIDTPIDIKVDEYGKLKASTAQLTEAESKRVEQVMDFINNAVSVNEEDADSENNSPDGLEDIIDEAIGLKDILDKFHEKENMYKAMMG